MTKLLSLVQDPDSVRNPDNLPGPKNTKQFGTVIGPGGEGMK